MRLTEILSLFLLIPTAVPYNVIKSMFEMQNQNIGSLCSGFTDCQKSINDTLAHSLLGCAVSCLRNLFCQSFNYQLSPYGPNHSHRCEMSNQGTFALQAMALRANGYNYYKKLPLP